MNKKIKILVSLLLTVAMVASVIVFVPKKVYAAKSISGGTLNKATFIIDPGHGGSDPGACNGSRKEAVDVLRLAKRVGELIIQSGETVAFTRVTEVYNSPSAKASIANSGNFSYFVSIHRNSASASANGIETFRYSGVSASSAGGKLTSNIHNAMVATGVWKSNRGVKTASYTVLKNTNMPATLLEVGFISNSGDNSIFDNHFETIARSIATGMLKTVGKTLVLDTDKEAPKISNISVSDVNENGYKVNCTVTDNKAVKEVLFPITFNGTTKTYSGTISGTTASCTVKASDFGGKFGVYKGSVKATDSSNNFSTATLPDTYVQFSDLKLKTSSSLAVEPSALKLLGVYANTTVSSLTSQFDSSVTVCNANGATLASTSKVGTGSIVKSGTRQVTVIVVGDVDGDGNAANNDYALLKASFKSANMKLEGAYLEAADVNGDGKYTTTDLIFIKRHINGTLNIYS